MRKTRKAARRTSTAASHPQSLISNLSRSGISLMEVMISVFILSIGLLGVAALIPVGKLAMIETEKADRTGACGRAALQEVRVRDMCNPYYWQRPDDQIVGNLNGTPNVVVLDPLGRNNGLKSTAIGGTSGILTRYTLTTATTSALAEALCRWHDDLSFSRPDEITAGTATVGSRPMPDAFDTEGNPEAKGYFSWFVTIAPQYFTANGVTNYTGTFNVAVAVCYKRILSTDGERVATAVDAISKSSTLAISNGGGAILLSDPSSGTLDVKENQWILLYFTDASGKVHANWYRVVNAGPGGDTQMLMLTGPDCTATGVKAAIIDGVTGVYTTTVQAD